MDPVILKNKACTLRIEKRHGNAFVEGFQVPTEIADNHPNVSMKLTEESNAQELYVVDDRVFLDNLYEYYTNLIEKGTNHENN